MAMVRPQVRPHIQDNHDMFFCGTKSPCQDIGRIKSVSAREQKLLKVASAPQQEFNLQLRSRTSIMDNQVIAKEPSSMGRGRKGNVTPQVVSFIYNIYFSYIMTISFIIILFLYYDL